MIVRKKTPPSPCCDALNRPFSHGKLVIQAAHECSSWSAEPKSCILPQNSPRKTEQLDPFVHDGNWMPIFPFWEPIFHQKKGNHLGAHPPSSWWLLFTNLNHLTWNLGPSNFAKQKHLKKGLTKKHGTNGNIKNSKWELVHLFSTKTKKRETGNLTTLVGCLILLMERSRWCFAIASLSLTQGGLWLLLSTIFRERCKKTCHVCIYF